MARQDFCSRPRAPTVSSNRQVGLDGTPSFEPRWVQAVAPIPWFPGNRWLRGVSRASAAPLEQADGFPVSHPRFLSVPRYAKSADGLFYFLSLAPFVARLRRQFAFEIIDAHFAYPD